MKQVVEQVAVELTTNPHSRFFHCMCSYVDTHQIAHVYIFGGREEVTHFNDVWHISAPLKEFTERKFQSPLHSEILSAKSELAPQPRRSASMVYHPQRHSLVVYGGRSQHQMYGHSSELWEFHLTELIWTLTTFKNDENAPGPLRNHSVVLRNGGDSMVLCGGYKMLDFGLQPTHLMHEYCFSTNTWRKLNATLAKQPSDFLFLSQHTAALIDDNTMLVYGGVTASVDATNAIYIFKFDELKWYQLELGHTSQPPGRYGHAACMIDGHLFISSGVFNLDDEIQDLWSLDFNKMEWTQYNFSEDNLVFGHQLCALIPHQSSNYFVHQKEYFNNTRASLVQFGRDSTDDSFKLFSTELNVDRVQQLEMYKSNHPARKLYERQFLQMFTDQSSGDIYVNNYRCHSYILSSCLFFDHLMKNKTSHRLELSDISDEILNLVLRYIYSNSSGHNFNLETEIDQNFKLLISLGYEAANYFNMSDLTSQCVEYLTKLFKVSTILDIASYLLESAERHPNCKCPVEKLMFNTLVDYTRKFDLALKTARAEAFEVIAEECLPTDTCIPLSAHMRTRIPNASHQVSRAEDVVLLSVTSILGTEKLAADRCILSSRCDYFQCLFNQNFEDSNNTELDFTTEEGMVARTEMELVLSWIYCGDIDRIVIQLENNQALIERLVVVANMLLLDDLADLVIQYEESTLLHSH